MNKLLILSAILLFSSAQAKIIQKPLGTGMYGWQLRGLYYRDSDEIYIDSNISKELFLWVVTHEGFHRVWHKDLTEIQKRLYCRRFDRKTVQFPTEYSKVSCKENFAESRTHKLLNK